MPQRPFFNVHHVLFRAYFGLLGWVIFLLLRPGFDLGYYMRPSLNLGEVRERAYELSGQFGFPRDSVGVLPTRLQRTDAWSEHRQQESLQEWASSGDLLAGWEIAVVRRSARAVSQTLDPRGLYERVGPMFLVLDDAGRVRELQIRKYDRDRFFVAAPSAQAAADSLFGRLGYPPVFFSEAEPAPDAPGEAAVLTQAAAQPLLPVLKARTSTGLPVELHLERTRGILNQNGQAELAEGFQLASVKIGIGPAPAPSGGIFTPRVFAYLAVYFVLLAFVLWAFFRRVTRRAIEWGRGLGVLLVISALYWYWRVEFWNDVMVPVNNPDDFTAYMLSELFNGIVFGGFGAVAYLAWESMAREDRARQLPVVDAFWRGRVFYRETGRAIIDGYAFAGIYLCIQALVIYGMGEAAYLSDSQYGHTELLKAPLTFSLSANALFYGFFTATFLWGVGVQLFENLKINVRYRHAITIAFLVISVSGAGRVIDASGGFLKDLAVALVTVPIVYAVYLRTGIVTLITLFGVAFTGYHVLPFLQATDESLFRQGLAVTGLALLPLAVAMAAAAFAPSVESERVYRPKYMDELEKQSRIENEIRIAAESQYTLLPQHIPAVSGASIHGFFIPSAEVGGDFFDYVTRPGPGGSESLAFVIADVSGKAMKAALQAIFTNGLILSRIRTDDPGRLLSEVNRHLYDRTDARTFVTALVGNYHPETRELVLASAGHCQPVLKRGGRSRFLDMPAPRFPLGLRPETTYAEWRGILEPGDFLFLYSDGLPESADAAGNTFGYDQLTSFIDTLDTARPAAEICAELKQKVRALPGHRLLDDTTIVCLSITA